MLSYLTRTCDQGFNCKLGSNQRLIPSLLFRLPLTLLVVGCSTTTPIALMSNANLEGQTIPYEKATRWLVGRSCGNEQSLSKAFLDATLGTRYDILVDVRVKTSVSIFASKNCITVVGKGLGSHFMNHEHDLGG